MTAVDLSAATPMVAENNDTAIRRSASTCLTATSRISADVSRRPAGPTRRPSQIGRKACKQIKLIGPLTDPTAFGGRAEDAFDVVIPSLPGYGFSSAPTEASWGSERIGRSWDVLMKRLAYARYVAQGGDWGAGVVEAMGRQAPTGLLGIHTNLPATVPNDVGAALAGGPTPPGLSEQERAVFDALRKFGQNGEMAYVAMMGARPQAVRYGQTDSPAGLAGWMLVHPGFAHWT